MRIHLTGAIWHAGMAERIKKAFESLGHEVLFFDEKGDSRFDLAKKILSRVVRWPYKIDDKFRARASYFWIESVKKYNPDLIIIEYAVNIMPDAIAEMKKLNKPIVYWVTSPPDLLQSKDILWSVHFANYVFSMDRAWMPLISHFAPQGLVYHLPLAGSPENFYPLEAVEKKFDISFVGSFSPQYPDGLLRAYFIHQLPERYKIAVYGQGIDYWSRYFPKLSHLVKFGGSISNKKLNEIYNQSKIVLNIHSTGHRTSISARTFDAVLAGAFQIVDWREDLERLFPPASFPAFRTTGEMLKLIDFWINKPKEREIQVKKVQELTKENHIWRNRAEEILKII